MTQKSYGPMAALIGGAILGAAAAFAMSDTKTRNQVASSLKEVGKKGGAAVRRTQRSIKQAAAMGEESIGKMTSRGSGRKRGRKKTSTSA